MSERQRGRLVVLIGSVNDRGEAAVGARGLSGEGYRGHVFWDSDVFVLRSEGVEIIRTPFRAPNANAFAERWVGTQLERVLRVYVDHYNRH